MTATSERVRLAITAFGDSERLCSTVKTLLDIGFARDQICVIARACALAEACLQSRDNRDSDAPTTLDWLCPCSEAWRPFDGTFIVATSGPVLQLLRSLSGADGATGTDSQAHAAQALDFDSHLSLGAVVLVVRSCGPRQQLLSTRTLLTSSQHRVSAHEFSVLQTGCN